MYAPLAFKGNVNLPKNREFMQPFTATHTQTIVQKQEQLYKANFYKGIAMLTANELNYTKVKNICSNINLFD